MMIREPAVAGTFYPATPDECGRALDECFAERGVEQAVDDPIIGGLVPHAGWVCSGMIAARVFSAIAAQRTPEVVVIFGAAHRSIGAEGAVFPGGKWNTPLGSMTVDERLGERVMGHTNLIADDPYAHEAEHSIEVQVPLIQRLWPEAKLLPITVPPTDRSVEVGDAVGRTLTSYNYNAIVIASSDLTHYGSRYGFTPQGRGDDGLDWAKNVNDRRLIDRMLALDAGGIVPETREHRNACGGGAIAAAMTAAKTMGAQRGVLLEHATSRETLGMSGDGNAVGYAGIVFTGSASP